MPGRPPNSPNSVAKPTQIDPQVDPKSSQNRSREGSGATGWPQVRPKSAKKPPKSAPEAPREGPGSAPRLPKGASEGQEERPRGPKGAPRRPRGSPSRLQVAPESEKVDFLKIAFSCTRERDFQGLRRLRRGQNPVEKGRRGHPRGHK